MEREVVQGERSMAGGHRARGNSLPCGDATGVDIGQREGR